MSGAGPGVETERAGRPRRGRWPSPEWLVFGLVAAILVRQLLVPPFIGLADNGDYARVLDPLGLRHVETDWAGQYFGWLGRTYVPGPVGPVELWSSQLLLSALAKAVAGLFRPDGVVDIRVQGAVNLVLYLAGIALLLRAARTFRAPARAVIVVALLLASVDVAWIAPLNSFYAEAATLVFLVLLAGFGLLASRDERARRWALPGYLLAAALFVAAKPQNHLLALPLAAVPLALLARLPRTRSRVATVAATLALVALGVFLQGRVPWMLRVRNVWNGVFYTILADSPDPRGDLAELGLPADLVRFRGVPAFAEGIPIEQVTEGLGYGDVVRFYARHPLRLVRIAHRCAGSAFAWRDPRIGNFTRDSGRPAGTLARAFSGWSQVEGLVLPRSLLFLVLFLGGVLAMALLEAWRAGAATPAGGTAWMLAGLALAAGMQFGACVVGDGYYDLVKHLYLFQLLFDACLVATLAWAVDLAARKLPEL